MPAATHTAPALAAVVLLLAGCGEESSSPASATGANPTPPVPEPGPVVPDDARLPDLAQAMPLRLDVRRADGRWQLGFFSAVENRGRGPIIIRGRRIDDTELMRADQVIRRGRGRPVVIRGVGWLKFVRNEDHRHWHLLDFERYLLRRASDHRVVAGDRKTGFCLGDRYKAVRRPDRPRFKGNNCGKNKLSLEKIVEGITPGWGDDYQPHLEGQEVDVTDVPAGTYELVHRTNVTGRLEETRKGNDASSVRITLRRQRGRPKVRVLRRCLHSATCPP